MNNKIVGWNWYKVSFEVTYRQILEDSYTSNPSLTASCFFISLWHFHVSEV